MAIRHCPHCEFEVEWADGSRSGPVCGLDPSLPPLAFDDAPAYFLAGDPRGDRSGPGEAVA